MSKYAFEQYITCGCKWNCALLFWTKRGYLVKMCLTLDLDLWPFTLTFDLDLDLWALFYMWKQVKLRFFRQKCGFLDKTWIFSQNALWLPPMICLFQYFKICKISTCKITLKGQGQRSRSKVKVKVKVKVKGQGQRSRSRVTI